MDYNVNTAYDYLKNELLVAMVVCVLIVLICGFIWLIFEYFSYDRSYRNEKNTKSGRKKNKNKKQRTNVHNEIWIVAAVSCLLIIIYMIPMILDICTRSVFIFDGGYCVKESYYVPTQYYVDISMDGEDHSLRLIDKSQIPSNGEHYGTLVYSKYSKKLFFFSG